MTLILDHYPFVFFFIQGLCDHFCVSSWAWCHIHPSLSSTCHPLPLPSRHTRSFLLSSRVSSYVPCYVMLHDCYCPHTLPPKLHWVVRHVALLLHVKKCLFIINLLLHVEKAFPPPKHIFYISYFFYYEPTYSIKIHYYLL